MSRKNRRESGGRWLFVGGILFVVAIMFTLTEIGLLRIDYGGYNAGQRVSFPPTFKPTITLEPSERGLVGILIKQPDGSEVFVRIEADLPATPNTCKVIINDLGSRNATEESSRINVLSIIPLSEIGRIWSGDRLVLFGCAKNGVIHIETRNALGSPLTNPLLRERRVRAGIDMPAPFLFFTTYLVLPFQILNH